MANAIKHLKKEKLQQIISLEYYRIRRDQGRGREEERCYSPIKLIWAFWNKIILAKQKK